MEFRISGTRKRVIKIVIEEQIEGDFNLTKKEVMDKTGCRAVEDGDPTAWYGYAEEAVRYGANQTDPNKDSFLKNKGTTKISEVKKQEVFWSDLEVDWG